MSTRPDPPQRLQAAAPETSAGAEAPQPLALGTPPQAADELPLVYGTPALELLVVDPANLFVSWEITPAQLEESRSTLGESFGIRKLYVDIILADAPADVICRTALFGDYGRWFLQVPPVGKAVQARLYFAADGRDLLLQTAGPVALPRTSPVEPDAFVELNVSYGTGPGERLQLARVSRTADQPLPRIDLGPPRQLGDGPEPRLPGSPANWSGNWEFLRNYRGDRDD